MMIEDPMNSYGFCDSSKRRAPLYLGAGPVPVGKMFSSSQAFGGSQGALAFIRAAQFSHAFLLHEVQHVEPSLDLNAEQPINCSKSLKLHLHKVKCSENRNVEFLEFFEVFALSRF